MHRTAAAGSPTEPERGLECSRSSSATRTGKSRTELYRNWARGYPRARIPSMFSARCREFPRNRRESPHDRARPVPVFIALRRRPRPRDRPTAAGRESAPRSRTVRSDGRDRRGDRRRDQDRAADGAENSARADAAVHCRGVRCDRGHSAGQGPGDVGRNSPPRTWPRRRPACRQRGATPGHTYPLPQCAGPGIEFRTHPDGPRRAHAADRTVRSGRITRPMLARCLVRPLAALSRAISAVAEFATADGTGEGPSLPRSGSNSGVPASR